jgi:hypothetical protein
MNRYCLLFVLIGLLPGCRTARVRAEASPVLRCPEREIELVEREPGNFIATGCGRLAACWLPTIDRAEVRCEGGAEMAPSAAAPR